MPQTNEKLRSAYKKFFEDESGQVILHDLINKGHIFKGIKPNDAMQFCEGERNIVLHILAMANYSQQPIKEMLNNITIRNKKE